MRHSTMDYLILDDTYSVYRHMAHQRKIASSSIPHQHTVISQQQPQRRDHNVATEPAELVRHSSRMTTISSSFTGQRALQPPPLSSPTTTNPSEVHTTRVMVSSSFSSITEYPLPPTFILATDDSNVSNSENTGLSIFKVTKVRRRSGSGCSVCVCVCV